MLTPEQFRTFCLVFLGGLFFTWMASELLHDAAVRRFDSGDFCGCLLIAPLSFLVIFLGIGVLWWFVGAYPFR